MSPFSEKITDELIQRLTVAADRSFDYLIKDVVRHGQMLQELKADNSFDYPVAAMALDKAGLVRLGQGVSTDVRSGAPTAHAEENALRQAKGQNIEPRIMVSTLESCQMCHTSITHRFGHGGLIAYVSSREVSEDLGHVNRRPTTDHDSIEGVQSLQLTHPRLQTKGLVLLQEHVTRDPRSGRTEIEWESLEDEFSQINREFPLEVPLFR
jgi:tRNA(Arg) A34 adenosine deaminase TadA